MIRRSSQGVFVATFLLAGVAHGQSPAPTPHGDTHPAMTPQAAAQASFKRGVQLANRADATHDPALFEAAYLQYVQAYSIYPTDPVLWSLAVCEVETKRYLDALHHLRVYDQHLRAGGTQVRHDYDSDLPALLAQATNATGHLTVAAPVGAAISVDGHVVGVAPLAEPLDVSAGSHLIDVQVADVVLHDTVAAEPGKVTAVSLFPPSTPTPVPVVLGTVPVAPGAGHTETSSAEPYWNGRRTAGAVIAGTGVVGAVLGGVFGGLRGGATSDANAARASLGAGASVCYAPSPSQKSACASELSAHQSNGTDASIEDGLLIGGAVLVATGLAVALWPGSASKTLGHVTPSVGPQMAGLRWAGSF